MGAWGWSIYENDDALDLVNDILSTKSGAGFIKEFKDFLDNIDLSDMIACSKALVYADIIGATRKFPSSQTPDELKKWLADKNIHFSDDSMRLLKQYLVKIVAGSELNDLWKESDQYENWKGSVNEVIQKLS